MFLSRNQLLQDFFGVFEALGNLRVVTDKFIGQVVCLAIALLVDISNVALVRGQKDFRVVVKDNLDRMVAEAEKDSVLGSDPFLKINERLARTRLLASQRPKIIFLLSFLLLLDQIVSEVLQKCDLLLQFPWEVR